MDKRAQKRFRRENRPNKGANTQARLNEKNAAIRAERHNMEPSIEGMTLALGMLAMAKRGR